MVNTLIESLGGIATAGQEEKMLLETIKAEFEDAKDAISRSYISKTRELRTFELPNGYKLSICGSLMGCGILQARGLNGVPGTRLLKGEELQMWIAAMQKMKRTLQLNTFEEQKYNGWVDGKEYVVYRSKNDAGMAVLGTIGRWKEDPMRHANLLAMGWTFLCDYPNASHRSYEKPLDTEDRQGLYILKWDKEVK